MLRAGVGRGCGLQPILLRSAACPYSTLNASAFSVRPKPRSARRPSDARKPLCRTTSPKSTSAILSKTSPIARRHASSSSSSTASGDAAAASAAAAKQAAAQPDEAAALDWNTFFALRKSRRRWQLACSIVSCGVGGSAGALFLGGGAADGLVSQVPLDPFVTLGLMTFGFAALGWLAGPSLGNAIFYTFQRKYKTQMTLVSLEHGRQGPSESFADIISVCPQKESQFFARIKKNRVDPSASSAGNPGAFHPPFTRPRG